MSQEPISGSHHEDVIAHVMPVPVLLGVFFALIVMTVLTVAATWIDLALWNLPLAMAIASVKATLVALYFMHLRYDAPFNGVMLLIGLVCVALFILITLLDTLHYKSSVDMYRDQQAISAPGM